MKPTKTKHYNLVIRDAEKWHRLKMAAAIRGKSIRQVIDDLLDKWLDDMDFDNIERYLNK